MLTDLFCLVKLSFSLKLVIPPFYLYSLINQDMLSGTWRFLCFTLLLSLVNSVLISCNSSPGDTHNIRNHSAAKPKADVAAPANNKQAKTLATFNNDVYDTTKQYIYLTFDDGPQPGTMSCFHTIKQLGVKASFFMVGMHRWDAHYKAIADTIDDNYPVSLLANHSFSHAFRDKYKAFYTHPYAALADFKRAQDSLQISYKIVRLPGNSSWVRNGVIRSSKLTRPICVLLDSAGYKVIGWDVEWNFKPEAGGARPVQSVATMVKMIENTLQKNECYKKNNIVLLAHDRMFHTPAYTDSLFKFVSILKQNPHYVFETVDKYPMQRQTSSL
jgi:peptidoglycan/xylan/chitin deacetylase (PgdA/CDA1 family)